MISHARSHACTRPATHSPPALAGLPGPADPLVPRDCAQVPGWPGGGGAPAADRWTYSPGCAGDARQPEAETAARRMRAPGAGILSRMEGRWRYRRLGRRGGGPSAPSHGDPLNPGLPQPRRGAGNAEQEEGGAAYWLRYPPPPPRKDRRMKGWRGGRRRRAREPGLLG